VFATFEKQATANLAGLQKVSANSEAFGTKWFSYQYRIIDTVYKNYEYLLDSLQTKAYQTRCLLANK
jgi:hypothetical protein